MFMLCPICNGFEQLSTVCPNCQSRMIDYGQIHDYSGPYSPYLPDVVGAASSLMETMDVVRECQHVVYCLECGLTCEVSVQTW